MRIDLYNSATSQLSSEATSAQASASNLSAAQSSAAEDRTTLKSGSSSVGSLVSQAMNTPAVRADKVASLQQAISSGQYELDPHKIAASMLDEYA
jgi:flagellar biosynthesis anti-sigma factor FlgM